MPGPPPGRWEKHVNDNLDLVIFDCDGVLVDSEILAVEVDQRILAEFGWHLSIDEIVDRFLGTSSATFRAKLEDHLGYRLADDWEDKYHSWFYDSLEEHLQPIEGIVGALDRITLPTCVASSGSHSKMRQTLGHTKLFDRFDGRIYSSTEVEHGKPAPDLFLYAAKSMGADPARCVVIEDSQYGVQAALAAGMHVLGYAGGLTPAKLLADAGAPVFTSMTELPELIAGIGRA